MVITISKGKNLYLFHKVPYIELSVTLRNLAIMLRTGLQLEDALRTTQNQATDGKLQETYGKLLNSAKAGIGLAQSMKDHADVFPQIVIAIITVGEQSGKLEENLLFLAEYLKKVYYLQKKIKGAMMYPFIILGIAFVEMLGIIFFFLPKLEGLYTSIKDPPKFTVMVISSAAYIRTHVPLVVGVVVGAIVIVNVFFKTKPGKKILEWLSLNFPVIKDLTKKNILLTFSRTMSLLLESGIAIQEALRIVKSSTSSPSYQKALEYIYNQSEKGNTVSHGMLRFPKLFPESYSKMIEVSEETGSLETNLTYLYEFYSDEVNELTNNLTALLEPIMLVFVAVIILGIAMVIIAPLYQLTGSISSA